MTRALRIVLAAWFALLCVSLPADAATPSQDLMLFGKPGWVKPGATIDLNFATGQSYLAGAAGPLTNSRSTPSWCLTSAGALVAAASGQNCMTDLGVASFEQRTNSIRNNTMVGAVVGTPGTLPTDWTTSNNTGLVPNVVGFGTQNGMPYIDLSIIGTSTGTGQTNVIFEVNNAVAASYGQTWTLSLNTALMAGSLANITSINMVIQENNSGGSAVTAGSSAITPGSAFLTYRPSFSRTLTNTATAFLQPYLQINISAGLVVNATIRLFPQLELNPNLPASVASATVAGGGTAYVGASGTMTYSGAGCTTNPVLNVTTSAGAINAVTSVATAGVCPAANGLPAAGSTSWTPGGGLSVGTGASFTLVPTDNSAKAFATPPILTSAGAVTRNADNISVATQPCANPSLLAIGTPFAPSAYPNDQIGALMSVGASYFLLRRIGGTGAVQGWAYNGTNFAPAVPGYTWSQGTSAKIAAAANGSTNVVAVNNGTPASASWPAGPLFNLLTIGGGTSAGYSINGYISRVALACGTSLLPY